MCRIYRPTGSQPYVRLCSYFGERKGDRISPVGLEWNYSGHVRKMRMGRRVPTPRYDSHPRCPSCHRVISRDGSLLEPCDLCVAENKTQDVKKS